MCEGWGDGSVMIGIEEEQYGKLVYHGDTFKIIMNRYSDPNRLNAARNAAIYLGKPDRDNIRRPLKIIRDGHVMEVFRGEYAEFEFVGVSKEVYDHIVTYTTRNMRVAGGNRALTSDDFTMPSDKMKNPELVRSRILDSMHNYKYLLDAGETPQVARSSMPVNAKMNNFVYQFNFVTLGTAVFKQRIWEKGAQGNTVKVIKGMYELCHAIDPDLWDEFYDWYGEPATDFVQVRRTLKKHGIKIQQFASMLESPKYRDLIFRNAPMEEVLVKMFGEKKSMWD